MRKLKTWIREYSVRKRARKAKKAHDTLLESDQVYKAIHKAIKASTLNSKTWVEITSILTANPKQISKHTIRYLKQYARGHRGCFCINILDGHLDYFVYTLSLTKPALEWKGVFNIKNQLLIERIPSNYGIQQRKDKIYQDELAHLIESNKATPERAIKYAIQHIYKHTIYYLPSIHQKVQRHSRKEIESFDSIDSPYEKLAPDIKLKSVELITSSLLLIKVSDQKQEEEYDIELDLRQRTNNLDQAIHINIPNPPRSV